MKNNLLWILYNRPISTDLLNYVVRYFRPVGRILFTHGPAGYHNKKVGRFRSFPYLQTLPVGKFIAGDCDKVMTDSCYNVCYVNLLKKCV